ncbi:MAG: hypothetical protein ACYS8X_07325 [Planctomycetota bacterium]|jgi:hypothetical protein
MANLGFSMGASAILLVFYLYLLVRWDHVRRPVCFLIGAAGLLFALFGHFFAIAGYNSGAAVVTRLFDVIGAMVAFVFAVAACYGAKLPLEIRGVTCEKGAPGQPADKPTAPAGDEPSQL